MEKPKKLKILAASDLHGDKGLAKKLSEKAKEEKVDLVVLAGDLAGHTKDDGSLLDPFLEKNQKVVFVPGNWDSSEEVERFRKKSKDLDKYYVTYNGVGITGIGNKDWNLDLSPSDFEAIKNNFSKMKHKRKILVSHVHAKETSAEFSGIPGDLTLRKAVEYFQPDLLISAHIHEAEGLTDKINKTKVLQVGRTGKIIQI